MIYWNCLRYYLNYLSVTGQFIKDLLRSLSASVTMYKTTVSHCLQKHYQPLLLSAKVLSAPVTECKMLSHDDKNYMCCHAFTCFITC